MKNEVEVYPAETASRPEEGEILYRDGGIETFIFTRMKDNTPLFVSLITGFLYYWEEGYAEEFANGSLKVLGPGSSIHLRIKEDY